MNLLPRLALLSLALLVGLQTEAQAQPDDGWWFLDFNSRSGAPLNSLSVGIDSGKGFGFITVSDDDHDGTIHLPPVPNNASLALGVEADAEVGCDIWIVIGSSITPPQTDISYPLLILADSVAGEHLGMDSSPFSFPFPPTRELVPGERLTATGGQLAEWPDLRLVTADSSITTLDEYLGQVDTLPNFTGDVIVTDFLLSGNFVVPEPSTLLLTAAAGLLCCSRSRRALAAEVCTSMRT